MPRPVINETAHAKSHQRAEAALRPWLPWPGDDRRIEYRRFHGGWEARCTTCLIATKQSDEDPEPRHAKGCRDFGKWHYGYKPKNRTAAEPQEASAP